MAHIHRKTLIDVPIEKVWAALADVGALHTRLVPGFVIDCVYDGEVRTLTFGNGLVARERIIDVDPGRKRVAWSAEGGNLAHHSTSAQLFDAGGGTCRVVWLADLLPHKAAPTIATMIEQGLAAMKRHLEAAKKAPL
ncbi:MAG: SRPBCC family protein [Pseudomonadota bacterium]